MNKGLVVFLCIMLAFNISFVSVFGMLSDTTGTMRAALSIVNTLIPGLQFTSDLGISSMTTIDGFFKFAFLNKDLMLPVSRLDWSDGLSSQNLQDWFDTHVIPYEYDPVTGKHTFPTFGLQYFKYVNGDISLATPTVSSVTLSPTVYTAYISYTNMQLPGNVTFDQNLRGDTYSFVKVTVTFYCPDSYGIPGFQIVNSVFDIPFITRLLEDPRYNLLGGGADYVDLDIMFPIDQSFRVMYVGDQPYQGYLYWALRSFGYDVSLSDNDIVTSNIPLNYINLTSLTDTGIDIIPYLEALANDI